MQNDYSEEKERLLSKYLRGKLTTLTSKTKALSFASTKCLFLFHCLLELLGNCTRQHESYPELSRRHK